MTKGIELTCSECHAKQDVTEAFHDLSLYGHRMEDIQRLLYRTREQIPHYDDLVRRMAVYQETGLRMLDYLTRLSSSHPDCCQLMQEIRRFLNDINIKGVNGDSSKHSGT